MDIPRRAGRCYYLEDYHVKKFATILLAISILLGLTACSLSFLNKTTNQVSDDKPDSPPVESQEPSIPDDPDDPDDPAGPPAPDTPSGTDDAPDTLLPDPDKGDNPIDDPVEPPAKTDGALELTHTDVTLQSEGETFTLNVKNVPGIYACTFSSDNPDVASVDEQTGVVTAVANGVTNVNAHVESELGQRDFTCIVRCRWKTSESQPVSGEASGADNRPSLSGFFSDLQSGHEGLGAMMVMDGELLENYYPGLSSAANVEEILVQETMITTANVAVGLVKLSPDASLDDVIAVQNILQARIDTQANGGAFYPDSCDTWKAGVITSVSNCVGMFVYPDEADSLADEFILAFSN